MSGKGANIGKCIERTMAYLKWGLASRVSEAMQACKFTDAESHNPVKQMAVCRARSCKSHWWGKEEPTIEFFINATIADSSVSPLTDPTMAAFVAGCRARDFWWGGMQALCYYSLNQSKSSYSLQHWECNMVN